VRSPSAGHSAQSIIVRQLTGDRHEAADAVEPLPPHCNGPRRKAKAPRTAQGRDRTDGMNAVVDDTRIPAAPKAPRGTPDINK